MIIILFGVAIVCAICVSLTNVRNYGKSAAGD